MKRPSLADAMTQLDPNAVYRAVESSGLTLAGWLRVVILRAAKRGKS